MRFVVSRNFSVEDGGIFWEGLVNPSRKLYNNYTIRNLMGHLIKGLPFLFALSLSIMCFLTIACLFSAEPIFAQTLQKPAPPEFSLKFVPASETTIYTDPYTGEKISETRNKNTIEVKIKNQSFKEKINGVNYYLFYSISVRGHFASPDTSSAEYYSFYNYSFQEFPDEPPFNLLRASNSEYTTVSIYGDYPPNAQIDVTVTAMLMYYTEFIQYTPYYYTGLSTRYLTAGAVEGETNYSKQTFTLPNYQTSDNSPDPAVTITPSPNADSFAPTEKDANIISMPLATFTIIIVIFLSIITLLLTLILFKIRKPQQQQQ